MSQCLEMKVFNDSVTQNPFQYQPIPEPTIRSFKKDSVSVIISKPIPLTLLEIAQDPAMGTAYFCFPAFELYDRNSDEGVESSDEGYFLDWDVSDHIKCSRTSL